MHTLICGGRKEVERAEAGEKGSKTLEGRKVPWPGITVGD